MFRALRDASDKHEEIAAKEAEVEARKREAAAAAAVAAAANLTYGQFTNRPEVRVTSEGGEERKETVSLHCPTQCFLIHTLIHQSYTL